jgi:hypothetical protein
MGVYLKSFISFINEGKKPIIKFMCFDWDDNILVMPTKILMNHNGEEVYISTEEFAKIRGTEGWTSLPNSYYEFRDFGPRGDRAFLKDLKSAIKDKKFGPSWDKFMNCLKKGYIFAIITARGHSPENIREGVEYIIFNVMSDDDREEMGANLVAFSNIFIDKFNINKEVDFEDLVKGYLDYCDFIGVTYPPFVKNNPGSSETNAELGKKIAMGNFLKKVSDLVNSEEWDIRLGFSDDDKRNISNIDGYFAEMSNIYKGMKLHVIDTSNPSIKGGIKKQSNPDI